SGGDRPSLVQGRRPCPERELFWKVVYESAGGAPQILVGVLPNERCHPMRLTLRTLLAYMDDTLEPTQSKEIGQKVADSHVARELIERIKKVTRRRGVTVPPAAGPDKIDANTVAEYLDNDLPSDVVSEIEER